MQIRYPWIALALLLIASVSGSGQTDRPPEAPPLDRIDFPPYETRTLDNGLRVFAMEHDEQPVLSVQLVIGAGAADDPEGLHGLASFTTSLLDKGTTTRSAQEIAEAIDAVGGSISTEAAREVTTVAASVLADSTDLAFELVTDLVMRPQFLPEEIERLRQQRLSSLVASLQDPNFVADAVFSAALYGDHPYAHPADGTPRSVEMITREDIVAFHDTYFSPDNSSVIVVGAVSTGEAFELAESWFGSWEARNPPQADLQAVEVGEERRIIVIDNPSSVQTEIRIGQTTVPRNSPEYFPVVLATYVLGGPEGRLMQTLRSDRGLTYGAYEALSVRRGPSALYADTDTRTEMTVAAVDLILAEIERLRTTPVDEEELEAVKAYIIGGFPLTIETPADLAARLANLVIYDLPSDYLDTYRDELAAIGPEEVDRVARERFESESVLIVLFGRAEDFLDDIRSLGPVEVIPLADLDLDSPDFRR